MIVEKSGTAIDFMKGENMATQIQTLTIEGQRFVIMPESQYHEILGDNSEPPLPQPDAKGNYPAVASARVVLARKLLHRRASRGANTKRFGKTGRGAQSKP